MARRAISRVIDDCLIPSENAHQSFPAIQVGSEAWHAWLNEPYTRSFAFHNPQGTLTARREHIHGTWYWYAYRTRKGHLYKTYLGKSEELTLERLQEAVTLLSTERATPPKPPTSGTGMPLLHLLTTKLSVPPVLLDMVSRPRLMDRMNAAVRGPLTLIVAPAGWGKTTLLSSWHADPGRSAWPLAWVSLDAGDNDSIRFWTYVITALNLVHPGVGTLPLTLLQATPPPPIKLVLTSLLNALIPLSTETVLVLDDYHLIEAEGIVDTVSYLVEYLPANIHLIIASRHDPQLPLARLRGRGLLSELRADHLRFTSQETTAFLTEVMGLPLSREEVSTLQVRTEGWIAGLHLAALSLQGRDDVAGFIAAFSGSHQYVVDYLIEEVLSHQPAGIQDFLLQTCILDRLSGPLCDAVRRQNDSQALLEQVERTNLFLIPLDDVRQWYRYHHLFAEVLCSRLRQQQPTVVADLHRRASRWYEQHELFDEAVAHALAVPDIERAAHLIEQRAQFSTFPCQFQTLLGWLNRLPDALIRMRPFLCIIHALVLMCMYQVEEASARLQDAEQCLQAEMPAEQRWAILGQVASLRSQMARSIGDSDQCIILAQQALDMLPEAQETSLMFLIRAIAQVNALYTYLVDGDVTLATEQLAEAAAVSVRASGGLLTILRTMSNLARLQVLQGRLRQAAATYTQGVQLFLRDGGLQTPLGCPSHCFGLGDLLREWNKLDIAERHLRQGISLDWGTLMTDSEVVTGCYMALARLQQARGERIQAIETLDTFARIAHQYGFVSHLVTHGAAVRAQVELAQGNLAAAIGWAETSGVSASDDLSYPREQEYLTLARVRIAQGQAQPMGSFPLEALALLERLLEDAEPKARMRSVIEIFLLRALALQAQGKQDEALRTLRRALALAEPEGYIRLFLDEGAPMLVLLRQAYARQITPGYVVTLLEAAGEQVRPTPHRSSRLMDSLTAREREVLRLLIDGASNREIANHLVLSVNTVKKHVLSICGKLGVQTRAQAIAKARTLQLL
jgi:LuxR family transcriptional regulator, maltose regulon positive regulatory protein